MKAIVIILLAAIVISLGSGLFYMTGDKQDSAKVLKALKIRVGLSIVLILFLTTAFYFGGIS